MAKNTLIDKLKKTFWTATLYSSLGLSALGIGGCVSNPVSSRLPPKPQFQKINPVEKYALLVSAMSDGNSKYNSKKFDYDSLALFQVYRHLIKNNFKDENIFVLYSNGIRTPNLKKGDSNIANRIKEKQFNGTYDNAASRMNIKSIINGFKERVDENDKFIFYVLAHGGKKGHIYLEKGRSLIPYDFQKLINGWKSKSNWFLINSCYSGKLVDLMETDNVCLVSDTQSDTKGVICDEWMGGVKFLKHKTDLNNDSNNDGVVDCDEALNKMTAEAKQYWPILKKRLDYWHKRKHTSLNPNESSIIPKYKIGKNFKRANF